MLKIYTALAAAALSLVIGGTAIWVLWTRAGDPFGDCRGTQVAGGSIGGPFTLLDAKGRTVTDAEVLAKPSLVYFGYTSCPDVCPLDNARNAEAVDILKQMGQDVTPVFISVDPARDTPEVMADYAAAISPQMIGLTGTEAEVKAAANAYRVFYKLNPPENGFYLVDHSTFTYLMLPGSGFADFFQRDDSARQVADRVNCFLSGA